MPITLASLRARWLIETDEAAAAHPGVQFVKAPYFGGHPKVIDCFVDRVNDIVEGTTAMNCSLCKYREQVIGYEDAVGQVQAGHHHHVSGLGVGADHRRHHPHDHGRSHGRAHRRHGRGRSHASVRLQRD